MIRKAGKRPFRGDDVYNVRAGQRVSATLRRPGNAATAVVRIQNDGTTPDRFRLRKRGAAASFSVRLRFPNGS